MKAIGLCYGVGCGIATCMPKAERKQCQHVGQILAFMHDAILEPNVSRTSIHAV